jgi:hypothetical protein
MLELGWIDDLLIVVAMMLSLDIDSPTNSLEVDVLAAASPQARRAVAYGSRDSCLRRSSVRRRSGNAY